MNGPENVRADILSVVPYRGILKTETISRCVLWIVEDYPNYFHETDQSLCSDIFRVPMNPNVCFYFSLLLDDGKYLLRLNRLIRNRSRFNIFCSSVKVKFLIKETSCDVCQMEEIVMNNKDLTCACVINDIPASSSVASPSLEIRCVITIEIQSDSFQTSELIEKKKHDFITNMSSQELQEHLEVLLEGETNVKVELKVRDQVFSVHKTLLCSQSPVFAAMFEHEMLEKTQNKICITDISSDAMGEILKYIYFDSIGIVSIEEAAEVYIAADKYSITGLKNKCSEILKKNLSKDNLLQVLLLADRHSDKNLEIEAIQFLVKEGKELIETEEFFNVYRK